MADGLFDEINNVLDANRLLAGGREVFLFGEPVYYRVYAERQHVASEESLEFLAYIGLHEFYAPCLYWFLHLSPKRAAEVILRAVASFKNPQVNGLIRLAVLLGRDASDWLWSKLDSLWGKVVQAPDYYWSFKKSRERVIADVRLAALRVTGRSMLDLPGAQAVSVEALLADPAEAGSLLSRACIGVFEGNRGQRQTARHLDVLAYGAEVALRGPGIVAELTR